MFLSRLYTPEGFVGTQPRRQPNTCSSSSYACACIRIRHDYFSLLRTPQDKEQVNVHGAAAEAGGGGCAGMGLTGTFDACAGGGSGRKSVRFWSGGAIRAGIEKDLLLA
jgi:hypothetical protein